MNASPERTSAEDATLGASVASRLFAILDAFMVPAPARALSLTEISRRAALPLSTTHRMVAEWVNWGGLLRLDDGRYSLGLRLWEVGVQTPTAHNLRTLALPYLEDLYESTREHVHLAILDGRDALYVEKLSGHQAVHVISRVGGRLPLHSTGVGLVLLAFAPPALLDGYLASPLTKFTASTMTEPEVLRRRLTEIRATGVARMSEEMTPGSSSLAAPILDRTGQVVAAVSIVTRTMPEADPVQELAVRQAARGISRTLGYRRA